MPTYEFRCENCHYQFDIMASIQEKERGLNPVCPQCGKQTTSQIISAGLFIRPGGSSMFNPPGPGCAPSAGPGCCG